MMNKLELKKLEGVFGTCVEAAEPLLARGEGLRIIFKDPFEFDEYGVSVEDLDVRTKLDPAQNMERFRYASKSLCELAYEHKFLVLENAVNYLQQNIDVSKGPKQDPFHRDKIALEGTLTSRTITMLAHMNNPEAPRKMPTYYAMSGDVKAAIATLPTRGLSPAVKRTLKKMAAPGCTYAYFADEKNNLNTIHAFFPAFTEAVAERLPKGRLYKQEWRHGEPVLAIHSNLPHGVLHARPEGEGDYRALYGVSIEHSFDGPGEPE